MKPGALNGVVDEQVFAVQMGDISPRATAALRFLDWLEDVTGPKWVGTDRGAVKHEGRKPTDQECEVRKAALDYLKLHLHGEMD